MKAITLSLCLATFAACHNASPAASTANAARSETYACTMSDEEASPRLTFLIKKRAGDSQASLAYRDAEASGAGTVLEGCEADAVSNTKLTAEKLYLDCAGDGDAGYLHAELGGDGGLYVGEVSFPNGSAVAADGESLAVTCEQL